jgi:hypothetical protein
MKKLTGKYPLIIESHPAEYDGYDFITLIQYNDVSHLTIVDNSDKKFIDCYVLDLCAPTGVKEDFVIEVAQHWYDENRDSHPISVEFSKMGATGDVCKILRTFSIDFVTRVIGPLPHFVMKGTSKVRKRKRKPVPDGVRIVQKKLPQRF